MLGGRQHLGRHQRGQGVFLGAKTLEQQRLFVGTETVPDVDHLQGSVEYGGVGGIGEGIGHNGDLVIQAVWKALHSCAFHTVWYNVSPGCCRRLVLLLWPQAAVGSPAAVLAAQLRAGLGRGD